MGSQGSIKLGDFIKQALAEDRCLEDITTQSLNYGNLKTKAVIKAKEGAVCAGMNVAKEVFKLIDKKLKFKQAIRDGDSFNAGDILAKISGSVSSILSAERTVLNFLSKLSGVATLTKSFVAKVKPYRTRIMDTRKTTPGFRLLEKYAVRMGGGYNHRYDLSEAVLIKDNHIAALRKKKKGFNLGEMITQIRKKSKDKEIEIEVDSVADFKQVVGHSPDIIMLDNMNISQIRKCVKLRNKINKRIKLEASGNVNLDNVRILARLKVDRISIGKLTHSPKAIDISLEFIVR
ncbi:MAG: carboxylating nicotinate-nucleotide diphosphorylase [Candidatus Omnitrophica bacterium]|nr:carboxylating nicotinate-nucleotide diphosphorylase [Candidatus Omnitrophota bacterium]